MKKAYLPLNDLVFLALLFFFSFPTQNAFGQSPLFFIDSSYLNRHDIVYKTPAYEGFEGFPLGNGDMGGMVWNRPDGVEVQINKNDLFDKSDTESLTTLRGGVRLSIDFGAPVFNWIHLDEFEGRLSLKNAEAILTSRTSFMESRINSWVAPDKNVWFFKVKSSQLSGLTDGSKIRVSLERWGSRAFPGWYGYISTDTRVGLGKTRTLISGNDIILTEAFDELHFSVACRILGDTYHSNIISYNKIELESGQRQADHDLTVMVAIVTSNESDIPTDAAIRLLDDAERQTIPKERDIHRQWWNAFWNRSFVHIGNDYIENQYYLRRYLMASSSRGAYPVVFNGGLWTWNHDVRNWVTPHHWNTQQQYWGLCAQNDCDLLLPYVNTYFRLMPEAEEHAKKRGVNGAILWSEPHDFFGSMTFWDRGDMLNNFTPASQMAGLFWEYFEYTGDTAFLSKKAYPFMKKAAEFYVQKLQWDSLKNEYLIFPSQPYESPRTNQLKNPVTDRNMILANFTNCIKAAGILQQDKEKTKQWQHILDHLWPLPYRTVPDLGEIIELAWYPDGSLFPKMEERGKWLNGMSQNTSLVFPAGVIGIDHKNTREYNAVSAIVCNHSPQVNAISPDPIVAARMGLGDEALKMMTNGIRRLQHFPQGLFYNIDHWYNLSLYMDSVNSPDITAQRDYVFDERTHYPSGIPAKPFIQCGMETQSIYGAAVNEMLLQSNEGKIRVFPAVPQKWPAAFRLRARGAFMVSSEMLDDGTITGILAESEKGNICRVVNPWPDKKLLVRDISEKTTRIIKHSSENDVIFFKTLPGRNYLILLAESHLAKNPSVYRSQTNEGIKRFHEAVLGKERNF
jgi:alpha-L-fucosidase 2